MPQKHEKKYKSSFCVSVPQWKISFRSEAEKKSLAFVIFYNFTFQVIAGITGNSETCLACISKVPLYGLPV